MNSKVTGEGGAAEDEVIFFHFFWKKIKKKYEKTGFSWKSGPNLMSFAFNRGGGVKFPTFFKISNFFHSRPYQKILGKPLWYSIYTTCTILQWYSIPNRINPLTEWPVMATVPGESMPLFSLIPCLIGRNNNNTMHRIPRHAVTDGTLIETKKPVTLTAPT